MLCTAETSKQLPTSDQVGIKPMASKIEATIEFWLAYGQHIEYYVSCVQKRSRGILTKIMSYINCGVLK